MRLALFDLDETLLPIDSADTWSWFVVRRGQLDADAYGARIDRFKRSYEAGTFDVEAYARFQMELLALFPRATLDLWHPEFMDLHVRPHLRREAQALVESGWAVESVVTAKITRMPTTTYTTTVCTLATACDPATLRMVITTIKRAAKALIQPASLSVKAELA